MMDEWMDGGGEERERMCLCLCVSWISDRRM
jgi:hypothetical protein